MQSISILRRVAGLALVLASASHSQVIIRERVAIDPNPAVRTEVSSAVDATLRSPSGYITKR